MSLPPPEPLFEQLCALRDAENPSDPAHQRRWRVVSEWMERAFPGHTPETEDARQEALLSLVRHVHRMRAEAPLQAAKWVATIVKRKRVDALRARAKDPVRDALGREPRRPDATPLVDRLEADDSPTVTPAILEGLVTTVLDHVHRALEQSTKNPAKRLLRRTQAQAALLRLVCGWDADAIREALDHGEPISNDRLYKWVERGRAPVAEGLEHWRDHAGEDAERVIGVIEVLRETMEDRRADAGVPRPDRRRDRPEETE